MIIYCTLIVLFQVQSLLSRLPRLKPCPATSLCSSPTTFTERTLHTCDLFSTPGINDNQISSPLALPGPKRKATNHLATASLSSLRGTTDQYKCIHMANQSPEERDIFKSKSLGTLLDNHRVTVSTLPSTSSCPKSEEPRVKSYPMLSISEDEKKVRFTSLNTLPQGKDVITEKDSSHQETIRAEVIKPTREGNTPPSPVATVPPVITTVHVSSSTPLLGQEIQTESPLSSSLDFSGGFMNADQLPTTASAADGEDILGVSALSGDYYSISVPPEGEGRLSVLSQISNVLPEDFENDLETQPGLQVQSIMTRQDQGESPLTSSTPAANASMTSPPHNGQQSEVHTRPAKLTKYSVHDSLEQHDQCSSIFSSPQFGSIVSAAQSTSLSYGGSEHVESVTSLSPLSSPEGRQLVPLYTPRDSINLLLQRGADPNLCSVPLPPLFYTIRAGDLEAVQVLLKGGANTEHCLPLEVCE